MPDDEELIILKDKQARIILALADKTQKWNLSSLALATKVTYVHASRFVARCEELGIISTEKHGRTKSLFLTENGAEIAADIASILSKLEPAKLKPEPVK